MRVTTRMAVGTLVSNLDRSYERITRFQAQLSSGTRLNSLSDDPAAVERSLALRSELRNMEDEERDLFMADLGIESLGLDRLIQATYKLLGLQTYYTAGEKEVRAWTVSQGATAPQAAGVIHSDFERGFIRAEIYSVADLAEFKTEKAIREAGRLRVEGKAYVMQDGDVCHFLFNV